MRSWARHLTLKTPLFGYSKVYKCGPAKLMLVGNAVKQVSHPGGDVLSVTFYKHQEFQTSGACAVHYQIASQKK